MTLIHRAGTPDRRPSVRLPVLAGAGVAGGFAGSVVLALVGNSGAPRAPGAYWRWVPPLNGRLLGTVVSLHIDQLALVLLIGGWLAVGVAARRQGWPVSRLVIVAGVWALPMLFTPPLFSDDIYDYVAVGALQVHHFDPYLVGAHSLPGASRVVGAVSPVWSHTPTPYGPGFLLLAYGAAALSGTHDIVAVTLLRLLSVGSLLVSAPMIAGLARRAGRDPVTSVWLVICNPLTLTAFVGGGHNDAIMVALLLGAYLLHREGHRYAAQLAVVAAAEIKIVAIVGVAVLAASTLRSLSTPSTPSSLRSLSTPSTPSSPGQLSPGQLSPGQLSPGQRLAAARAEAAVGVAGFVAVTTGLGLTLGRGLLAGWGWVHDLSIPGHVLTALTPLDALYTLVRGSSRGRVPGRRGLPVFDSPGLVQLRDAALLLTLAVTVALVLRVRRLGPERATGLILFAVAILGETLWPWYLLWPLTFLATGGDRRERRVIGVLSVLCLFVDSPGGPTLFGDPGHWPGRTAADLLTLTAVTVAAAVLTRTLWRSPDGIRRAADDRAGDAAQL